MATGLALDSQRSPCLCGRLKAGHHHTPLSLVFIYVKINTFFLQQQDLNVCICELLYLILTD